MAEPDNIDTVWGPTPPKWKVLETKFWIWRKRLWWRFLKNTACKQRGHCRASRPVPESSARSWACNRCQAQLRGPDGEWLTRT